MKRDLIAIVLLSLKNDSDATQWVLSLQNGDGLRIGNASNPKAFVLKSNGNNFKNSMKTLLYTIVFCILANTLPGQNVGIGTLDPESMLEVAGDIKGDSLLIGGDSSYTEVLRFETGNVLVEQVIGHSYVTTGSVWQSITSPADGNGLCISLYFYDPSQMTQGKIYIGEGITGEELVTFEITVSKSGWFTLPSVKMDVDSGSIYTVWINEAYGAMFALFDPYPGGRASNGESYDLRFKASISDEAPFAIRGNTRARLSMPWAESVIDVEGTITSTNAHIVSRLGIGTKNPSHPLTISGPNGLMAFTSGNVQKYQWWLHSGEHLTLSPLSTTNPSFVAHQNGNIGIGAYNPQASLHLMKNASNPGTNDLLLIENTASGGAGIRFKNPAVPFNLWQCYVEADGRFKIGRDIEGDFITILQDGRMRISENLGIGAEFPEYRIDARIAGSNSTVAQFSTLGGWSDIRIQNQTQRLMVGVNGSGAYLNTSSGHDLRLQTGGNNRVFIDHESGNVGVGTINPTYRLYVLNSSGSSSGLGAFEGGGNSEKHVMIGNGDKNIRLGVDTYAGFIGSFTNSDFVLRTGNTDRIYIEDSNGFVGIGTATPENRLHVNGDVKVSGLIVNDPVLVPVLINSWENYGDGFVNSGYYKDKEGVVHLCGLIKNGNAPLIMQLPNGFRPTGTLLFTVVSGNSVARIDVLSNGDVVLVGSYNNAYVSLSGISFRP